MAGACEVAAAWARSRHCLAPLSSARSAVPAGTLTSWHSLGSAHIDRNLGRLQHSARAIAAVRSGAQRARAYRVPSDKANRELHIAQLGTRAPSCTYFTCVALCATRARRCARLHVSLPLAVRTLAMFVQRAPALAAARPLNVPHPCRMFETFSFLPPLSTGEIARQVDYIIANGWTPCLEFADSDCAYVQDKSQARFGNSASAVRVPAEPL